APAGYRLAVEEHPRYTFHFTATIPAAGRVVIRDTNYVSSEGTSRLAICGRGGVLIEGNDGPTDVEQVPIRPVWDLSDAEDRRTKQVEVRYRGPAAPSVRPGAHQRTLDAGKPADQLAASQAPTKAPGDGEGGHPSSLSRLLDGGSRLSWTVLALI